MVRSLLPTWAVSCFWVEVGFAAMALNTAHSDKVQSKVPFKVPFWHLEEEMALRGIDVALRAVCKIV